TSRAAARGLPGSTDLLPSQSPRNSAKCAGLSAVDDSPSPRRARSKREVASRAHTSALHPAKSPQAQLRFVPGSPSFSCPCSPTKSRIVARAPPPLPLFVLPAGLLHCFPMSDLGCPHRPYQIIFSKRQDL